MRLAQRLVVGGCKKWAGWYLFALATAKHCANHFEYSYQSVPLA